jgi:pimeloyl-ACP methyl ester carboxylesterase
MFGNLISTDPFVVPRILFHPRAMLLTTVQVRRIFFSPQYPDDKLEEFIQYLAESDSIVWAIGMIRKFVDFRRVVQRGVDGWGGDKLDGERILIMAGELDILMDSRMIHRLAKHYRKAVRGSVDEKVDRVTGDVERSQEAYTEDRGDGVRMVVVKGAGHHVQNDLQWEVGAQRVVDFLQQL